MTKIKICGIKEIQHVGLLVEQGVDFIGTVVNVPKSPRNITIEQALSLKKRIPSKISYACVTIPNSLSEVSRMEKELHPDMLQIHALENESFFKDLREIVKCKLILGLPIDQNGYSKVLNKDPISSSKILAKYCDFLLIDSATPGSGIVHDWTVTKKVRETTDIPMFLSGGLNPNNVGDAINTVQPHGIDVSSGVESSPGVKDEKLIIEFIKRVREVNHENK